MACSEHFQPIFAMVAVDIALAIVNILLKHLLNAGLNNLVIVMYRQGVLAAFLFPLAYFLERKSWTNLTVCVSCLLFFSALVGATLTQYFFLLGLKYTSATFTCAFLNMVPAFTFVLSLPFGLENVNIKGRSGKAKIVGTLVCIGGALLLTVYHGMLLPKHPMSQTPKEHTTNSGESTKKTATGSICLTVGSLMWSTWFLIQARISKKFPFQYSSTGIMSFFSATQSAILCFITDRRLSTWVIKGKIDFCSVLFAGMVGSGLCYVVMSWCVKKKGPVFTSAFSPFIQIIVAVFDVSILHDKIYLGSVLGSILVIIGLYILLWGKSIEAEECTLKHSPSQTTEGNGDSKQAATHIIKVTVDPSCLNDSISD